MPLVNKLSSGRIFSDDFTESQLNPIWQVSPTDPTRYDLNNLRAGYLRLFHGGTPLYLLMDLPNRDFVMEVKNDYTPTKEKDTAGIIVYRDNVSRIELLEYFDAVSGTSVTYTHMRMQKKGDVYTGYGSKDNGMTWELIGTGAAQDMAKIGLVINGEPETDFVNFDVDYVKVFSDHKFLVGNLTPGLTIELLDELDNVIDSVICQPNRDHVYIDMTNLPAPYNGKIRVSEGEVVKETSALMEIWGGDMFWYGLIVEVYRDTTLLPKDTETELGHMINGIIEEIVTIKNPGTDPISNVRVKVSQYFDYLGHDWVAIAEDVGNTPGTYYDSIFIGTLNPGEERKIWLKVTKEYTNSAYMIANHKFLLEVTC